MAVAALTDASVRLLELIQASAHQSRNDLPNAMTASEERLAAIEARAREVHSLLDQARQAGEQASASMDTAGNQARDAMEEIDRFEADFEETTAAQVGSIERLRASVAALGSENEAVATKAQEELREAIEALQTGALGPCGNRKRAGRPDRHDRSESRREERRIDRKDAGGTHRRSAGEAGKGNDALIRGGSGITRQLRDQLAKVNELTGNLESRIAHARERATEDVDNDFSRRVALITESLNPTRSTSPRPCRPR